MKGGGGGGVPWGGAGAGGAGGGGGPSQNELGSVKHIWCESVEDAAYLFLRHTDGSDRNK